MSNPSPGQTRYQRVEANCKKIWGADAEYDIGVETDDWEYYIYFVKKDYGDRFGPPLTMTGLCHGERAAWEELERMLGLWANQAERGTPMTREEKLQIFSGPNGEFRPLLERVENILEAKAKEDAEAISKNRAKRAHGNVTQ